VRFRKSILKDIDIKRNYIKLLMLAINNMPINQ